MSAAEMHALFISATRRNKRAIIVIKFSNGIIVEGRVTKEKRKLR